MAGKSAEEAHPVLERPTNPILIDIVMWEGGGYEE
jgi:hypothetical protein